METTALVLIETELGAAKEVAQGAADLDAVQWTVIVTGPFDVVAAVKVEDNLALGNLVTDHIHQIPGVKSGTTLVVADAYYGGFAIRGNEGFP